MGRSVILATNSLEFLYFENQVVDLNWSLARHLLFASKLRPGPQASPKTPVLVVHRAGMIHSIFGGQEFRGCKIIKWLVCYNHSTPLGLKNP
jgi:hypothetical protein